MGSVASFLAQFTEGLTGGLKEHHKEQKRLELRQQEQQLQTLQMAAQQAAQTGDTNAYSMILRQIGDFTSTGSGKAGKQGKQNIMHQFADMLENGVETQQEVPNLPQSGFEPQMGFNQEGQPSLTPKPPDVVARQNEAMLAPKQFELVRKPLFMSAKERFEQELDQFKAKENIKGELRLKEIESKNAAKLKEVEARLQAQAQALGIKTTAAYQKPLMSLASQIAARYNRTEIEPIDLQMAGDMLAQQTQDKHDRTTAAISEIKQRVADAPKKLALMQQRIDNALRLGTDRNAIAAGQLGLAGQKFDYQRQIGDQLKVAISQYGRLTTRLNQVNNDIAIATKDGNERGRDEGIAEALEIKTKLGEIEAGIEVGLGTFQQATGEQGQTQQPNVQTVTPPQIVTIGQNKFIIGKEYIVKGKRIVVDMVNGQPQVREVQ